MKGIIISRHPGSIAFAEAHGFEGEAVSHLDPENLPENKVVVGVIPLLLAEELLKRNCTVFLIVLPRLRPEDRGRELTVEEMEERGAAIRKLTALWTEPLS